MDETLMSKASFSEICRIMKHKDGAVRECIQSVVKLSLLLLPGLMCKDLAAAVALETGLVNVDVKNVVDETNRPCVGCICCRFRSNPIEFAGYK